MANLKMDTDAIRALRTEIRIAYHQIHERLVSLGSSVDSVVEGSWTTPAANEFRQSFEQWLGTSLTSIEELEMFARHLEAEIEQWEETAAMLVTEVFENPKDRRFIREWWHNILRNHGWYSSYAIFLVLPSDKEAIRYLTELGRELDLISGHNCMVIALGKTKFRRPGFDKDTWATVVEEQVSEGYSTKIAELFNIEFSKFPCLIIFRDIRSLEHVMITLSGMTAEEIADKLRLTFSTIKKAVSSKEDPVKALEYKRKEEGFRRAGQSIVGEIRSLAGKTFETAMEAFINISIK